MCSNPLTGLEKLNLLNFKLFHLLSMILGFESKHDSRKNSTFYPFATLLLSSKRTHFFTCTNSSHQFTHLSLSKIEYPMIHSNFSLIKIKREDSRLGRIEHVHA
ncbi:hypothetical protein AMTRI_Chr09g38210 [Amborella trichopoda]